MVITLDTQTDVICVIGPALPSQTMLWSHLPIIVLKRTCVGGTYAYCKSDITYVRTALIALFIRQTNSQP